jgi:4,5-dihydroxyphthalate decarboxylase
MRYDITMPLFEGRASVEGVTFRPVSNGPMVYADIPELRQGDFGLWDLNCGYLLPAIEAGWEFVTLPLFIKRKSVLQFIYVRSDIKSPADLAGKTVASRQYRTSVTIWARGLMKEHYGVDTHSLRWIVQTPEFFPNHDAKAKIELIDPKASLPDMLIEGKIDCLITDISDGPLWRRLDGTPSVRRLFPDYREKDFRLYKEHGIFPPMHVMVMSKKLDRAHPDLARKIYDAFEQAKAIAYQDLANDRGGLSLVDLRERFFDQQDTWGDPWVYGVAANRRMTNTYIRYNRDQGAIKGDMPYERIFAASTLDT